MTASELESICCPYCGAAQYKAWATERGFHAVRCDECRLIYCNPRPRKELIDAAVRLGAHKLGALELSVVARRNSAAVLQYQRAFQDLFSDLLSANRPINWLDVGAGYGEVMEAVSAIAPTGSVIEGLEPMRPKAEYARSRGLRVTEGYLRQDRSKVDVVSIVNVFSHIPDFRVFLADVASVLEPKGEIFVETGNLADVEHRNQFPGELGLPDHLVFAGETHLVGYLRQAGFTVVAIRRERRDGCMNCVKQVAKTVLGRPSQLSIPYTSRYRQLLIRARR